MAKTLLVVSSDHHINSTVALCPPIVNLDDGGTYRASRAQRWLWDCWLNAWAKIKRMQYDRLVVVLNGDLGELDTKRRSNQIITPNKSTVLTMALDVLEPMLELSPDIYVIRGTQAHEGKSAWLEEAIAQDLDGVKRDTNNASWWHLTGKINGTTVDIAHHVSMGSMPWTAPNSANKLAALLQWHYAVERRIAPPDLAVRSHNHRYADSGNNFSTRAYLTPCWSLLTEYGYRAGFENYRAHIGLLAFELDGADHKLHKITYTPQTERKVWSVEL